MTKIPLYLPKSFKILVKSAENIGILSETLHKILHAYDFPALFPVCWTHCATAPRNDLDLVLVS